MSDEEWTEELDDKLNRLCSFFVEKKLVMQLFPYGIKYKGKLFEDDGQAMRQYIQLLYFMDKAKGKNNTIGFKYIPDRHDNQVLMFLVRRVPVFGFWRKGIMKAGRLVVDPKEANTLFCEGIAKMIEAINADYPLEPT